MRNKRVFQIVFCAIMAAMAIALNSIASLQITQSIKITFYAIPLLVVGVCFGPLMGAMTGVVTGVVLQLISPYGISLSSPFWALAPVFWGWISGLCFKLCKKMNIYVAITIAVIAASVSANIINTFAMIMDSLLVKDSWYTLSAIMVDWPGRILTMAVTLIPYILITGAVVISFKKIYLDKENEKEENIEVKEENE